MSGINGFSSPFENFVTKKDIPLKILTNDNLNGLQNIPRDQFSFNKVSDKSMPTLKFNDGPAFIEYKVKRGESLSDISKKYFGKPDNYIEIFNANKDKLRNPNDLVIGMTLKIPVSIDNLEKIKELDKSEPPIKVDSDKKDLPTLPPVKEFKEITVGKGESLSALALQYLGNSELYPAIFEANRDKLKTPDSLKVGMKLNIPVIEKKPKTSETVIEPASNMNVDVAGMTDGAKTIYSSLKKYQEYHNKIGNTSRTKTTESEMKQISVELDKASKAFGVDSKIMLAVYAHESGGFNPRATSHTGAGGLGHLTGIAIRQVHYMAGMAKGQTGRSPFTEHKDDFIKSQTNLRQRHDISKNIWTSTAYMAYEINDRNNGNIKRSLERYGDPNVSTYENKVNQEYKILFGKSIF